MGLFGKPIKTIIQSPDQYQIAVFKCDPVIEVGVNPTSQGKDKCTVIKN